MLKIELRLSVISMKYLDYLFLILVLSFKRHLAFRSYLIGWLVGLCIIQIGNFWFISLLTSDRAAAGETAIRQDFYLLTSLFYISAALYNIFLEPSHDDLPSKIYDREIDLSLIRPMDSQFLNSFSTIGLEALGAMIVPIYILANKTVLFQLSMAQILGAIGSVILCFITYALVMGISVHISFWFPLNSAVWRLSELSLELGSRPKETYPSWFIKYFLSFIPTVYVMWFPTSVLYDLNLSRVGFLLLGISIIVILNRFSWIRGVKKYAKEQ